MMDRQSELERIRQYTGTARLRIRRLDSLLDEQIRILDLDPSLNGRSNRRRSTSHPVTLTEMRMFFATFLLAALGAFLAGFWTARFH
jgi:hypothetical protein